MPPYDATELEHHGQQQNEHQTINQTMDQQQYQQHQHQHQHQHPSINPDVSPTLVSQCGCQESINQIMLSQGMTPSVRNRGIMQSMQSPQSLHPDRTETPFNQFSPPLKSSPQRSPTLKPATSPNDQTSPSLKPQPSPVLRPSSSNQNSPQIQPLNQTGGSGTNPHQLSLPSPMLSSRGFNRTTNYMTNSSPGMNAYQINPDEVAVTIDTPRSMRLDPEYLYTPTVGTRTLKPSSHHVMNTPLTIDELDHWNSEEHELSDFSEPASSPKPPRGAFGRLQDRFYTKVNYFGAKLNMFTTWIYVTLNLALDPDFNADEVINNSIAQSVNMIELEKAPMSRRSSIASMQTINDTDSVVHWSPPPSTRGTPRYLSNQTTFAPPLRVSADKRKSPKLVARQGSTVSEMGTPLTLGGMNEQLKYTLNNQVPQTPRSMHVHGHSASCPVAKTKHRSLIKLLARGLMAAGIPMHVTDFYLKRTGRELIDQSVTVVTLPNCVLLSFGGSTLCHLVDAARPGLSLSRMVDTVHVAEAILAGNFSYEKSVLELRRVNNRPPLWSVRWQFFSMVVLSAAATPLFAGGPAEMAVAAMGALLISVMEQRMMTNPTISRGHDLLSGLFCSLLAIVVNLYIYPINVMAACFGGVLWVLPGLRVCMGMIDMSSGHMTSGAAKLMSALLTAVNLGIGITCGLQVMNAVDPGASLTNSSTVLPDWSVHLFVLACIFPSCVLMDAPSRHSPALALGMVTAYEISALSSPTVGTAFGAFFAACGAGLLANIWGRITPHPGVEFVMFSVLLILPGSIGVKSMLANDTISSVDLLLQMISVTIAIVTGLLASNAIIKPKRMM